MSNAVSIATKNIAANAVSGSFKRVVGGLLGNKKISSKSSFAKLQQPQGKSKHLSYPADVDTDPMQGHWVMFEILQLNPTKTAIASSMGRETGPPGTGAIVYTKEEIEKLENSNKTIKHDANISGGRSLYKALVEASVKLDKTIALYMPPSVSVTYNTNYADKEISNLANFGIDAIKAFTASANTGKSTLTRLADSIGGASDHLKAGLTTGLIRSADAIVPGIEAIMAIENGEIIGNHMELLFQGVGRRSFTFTFVFIPKSEPEAKTVEEICTIFKTHMLPKWANGTTKRAMTIPDMFDITYMYRSEDSKHLNKISTCFCESAQVTYGSDRYTAYEEGRPQRTTLALNFKEIEIITRERVEQGF